MEETLATASQDLPAEGAEEISWEVISHEGEGNSPCHQSFEEALFSWLQVLRESDKLLPITEEWRHNLTVSVTYFFFISIFSQFFLAFSFSLPSLF